VVVVEVCGDEFSDLSFGLHLLILFTVGLFISEIPSANNWTDLLSLAHAAASLMTNLSVFLQIA